MLSSFNKMNHFLNIVVVFAILQARVSARCRGGDAICHRSVSSRSWCKPESNTCHGRPDVRCNCGESGVIPVIKQAKRDAFQKQSCQPNHRLCASNVGPNSWCMENNTCKGGPQISCGCDSGAHNAGARVAAKCPNRHDVCTAINGASWCTDGGRCQGYPEVSCGCANPDIPVETKSAGEPEATSVAPRVLSLTAETPHVISMTAETPHVISMTAETPHVISMTAEAPRVLSSARGAPLARPTAAPSVLSSARGAPLARAPPRPFLGERKFVLWAEWPSLEEGAWPEYFGKLLSFIDSNCGDLRVVSVVMRILDPEFQRERGQLWQVSSSSSFYTDFFRHLPQNVEVHVYPYLMERASAQRWAETMQVSLPLEATFKFAREWNALLQATGVPARIAGIVTDKEERKFFNSEINNLPTYKVKYSSPGSPQLRFGWAIGFDSVGSIDGTSPHVDEFYVEMYDFYVNGIAPAVPVEAHTNGALNNPDTFLKILEEKVWAPHIPKYNRYPNIVFMWSLQHRQSSACNFPLSDGTCGERVDMGSWSVSAFNKFLDKLDEKHPVFRHRLHGLFQFNFVPLSWQHCPANR